MGQIERTLTSMESEALVSSKEMLNLTDGHPRQALTDNQRRIIATLPTMFDQALDHAFADIELRAHKSFFGAMGQHSAPFGRGRILSTYSSTIALDIVARVLAERIKEVAVLHPTFDNIADLFSARGLRLHPITEQQIDDGDVELPSSIGAVVVVHPNNPTGWVLTEQRLRALAQACARNGQIVVMDSSFRGQDSRAHYDTYAVLEASGAEWIVVEDTGKLWSVSELKSGFLSWNEGSTLRFVKCFDEVMLSVSPVILLLVDKLAEEARTGGFTEMQARLGDHRRLVADVLAGTSMELTDPDSRISVARISLPESGPDAYKTYSSLVDHGIHTLPCSRFYWARPHEGDRQLRLSLSRPTPAVEKAVRTLAEISRSA